MRVQYPIFIEEEDVNYWGGEYKVKQCMLMVPWKFRLFAEIGEFNRRYDWTRRPDDIEEMNDYIRRNKDTLRKVDVGNGRTRSELDKLVEFFSEEQRDEDQVLENLEVLLLLIGILDYRDYQDEIY